MSQPAAASYPHPLVVPEQGSRSPRSSLKPEVGGGEAGRLPGGCTSWGWGGRGEGQEAGRGVVGAGRLAASQAVAHPLARTQRILRRQKPVQVWPPHSHVPKLEGVPESASTLLGWLSWARLALRWALACCQKLLLRWGGAMETSGAVQGRHLLRGDSSRLYPHPMEGRPVHRKGTRLAPGRKQEQGKEATSTLVWSDCVFCQEPLPHKPRPHHKPCSDRPPGVSTRQVPGTLAKTKPTSTDVSTSFVYRTLATTSRDTCHSFTDGETEVRQFLECPTWGHMLGVLEQGPQGAAVSPPWGWGWTETPPHAAPGPQARDSLLSLSSDARLDGRGASEDRLAFSSQPGVPSLPRAALTRGRAEVMGRGPRGPEAGREKR